MPEHMPDDLMGGLPLLRAHASITHEAFVRWVCDLKYNVATHVEFVARVKDLWGLDPTTSRQEKHIWNFQIFPMGAAPWENS